MQPPAPRIDISPAGSIRAAVTALLITHQHHGNNDCTCGGMRLGDGYADHLTNVLAGAGLLRDK